MALVDPYMRTMTTPRAFPQAPAIRNDGPHTQPWPIPSRTGSNPYLDTTINYNGGTSYYDTPLSERMGMLNPRSEWTRLAQQQGMMGNDRRGQFGQQQYTQFQNAFEAAQLNNPSLNIRDFIQEGRVGDQLRNDWLSRSANQRGLNNASRSSIIRWG